MQEIFDKDPETITKEERAQLVAHFRAERLRFEELEKAGKRATKKQMSQMAEVEEVIDPDADPLAVKALR